MKNIGLYGFWVVMDDWGMWRVLRISWKKSKKPFESFSGVFTVITSIIAVAVLIHSITKDWGDDMIMWAGAAPVIVWWIYFVWNIVKLHHKFHKDRTPAIVTILLFVAAGFAVLFMVQISKDSQQSRAKPPAQTSTEKPPPPSLPDKIIPNPKPVPMVASVPPPKTDNVDAPKIFEVFNAPTGTVINVRARFAQEKAEQVAQQELRIQQSWSNSLPHFQRALVVLRDELIELTKPDSDGKVDGIAQSETYLTCLPEKIGPTNGEIQCAEIHLQNNTNMDFMIYIMPYGGYNQLKIVCSSGNLAICPIGNRLEVALHVNPDYYNGSSVAMGAVDEIISEKINDLVSAQFTINTNQP